MWDGYVGQARRSKIIATSYSRQRESWLLEEI